ncbi:MAG: hypothetical protein K2L88_06355, partial [Clostridiales bacterium]|nr:hypothetical protein [Clostridiales bacterium]
MATPLIACKHDDPVLILATDALDRVFNPFFYTSGPDGEIVSQTQIGMLSSNEKGELIADWNEPCVAHDWSIIKNGNPSMVQGNNYGDYYTDYYFALKDNIKFSDGTLLTKDDVLFNLYMYLDPAYTGSNTMYSVKIKGLTEYRTQTKDLNNAEASDANFENKVKGRLQAILGWIEDEDALWGDAYFADYEYNPDNVTPTPKNIERDITRIQEYYKKSLQETWTSVTAVEIAKDKTTGQSYIKEYEKYKDKDGKYIMTEPYQLFLYYNGIATLKEHFTGSGADTRVEYYEYDQSSYPGKIPANIKDRTGDKFRDQLI